MQLRVREEWDCRQAERSGEEEAGRATGLAGPGPSLTRSHCSLIPGAPGADAASAQKIHLALCGLEGFPSMEFNHLSRPRARVEHGV